jgi:hypothetical protein
MAAAKKPVVKAKKTKVKPQGVGNYEPNKILVNSGKKPLTLAEARKYNKLPKDTIFTLPKGAAKLSVKEKEQMQARRILDRQRTLARGSNIIRRKTLGK